jgi:4-diphosphocytidyl-2-C-methyl-D-erythritol kinase
VARSARVAAHAKLNLRLKVLGLESGGMHSVETILARIELADAVTVRIDSRTQSLRMNGDEQLVVASGPAEENLALRAARTYADVTGWPSGFEIEVEKRIPVRAGLGGGSADAAAVLTALQALSPEPVADADLLPIAASLGADVPFMVTRQPVALAWARGDRMLLGSGLPAREVLLLTPAFSVSTRDAYSWLDSTREATPTAPCAMEASVLSDWGQLGAMAENDFEVAVLSRHPEVAQMLAALAGAGATIARMSGSGSTVFGVFDKAPDRASAAVTGAWQVRRTRTLTQVAPAALAD